MWRPASVRARWLPVPRAPPNGNDAQRCEHADQQEAGVRPDCRCAGRANRRATIRGAAVAMLQLALERFRIRAPVAAGVVRAARRVSPWADTWRRVDTLEVAVGSRLGAECAPDFVRVEGAVEPGRTRDAQLRRHRGGDQTHRDDCTPPAHPHRTPLVRLRMGQNQLRVKLRLGRSALTRGRVPCGDGECPLHRMRRRRLESRCARRSRWRAPGRAVRRARCRARLPRP